MKIQRTIRKTAGFILTKEEIIKSKDRSFLDSLGEEQRAAFLKLDTESQKKFIMRFLVNDKGN